MLRFKKSIKFKNDKDKNHLYNIILIKSYFNTYMSVLVIYYNNLPSV